MEVMGRPMVATLAELFLQELNVSLIAHPVHDMCIEALTGKLEP